MSLRQYYLLPHTPSSIQIVPFGNLHDRFARIGGLYSFRTSILDVFKWEVAILSFVRVGFFHHQVTRFHNAKSRFWEIIYRIPIAPLLDYRGIQISGNF
jgi:hypothetical protein